MNDSRNTSPFSPDLSFNILRAKSDDGTAQPPVTSGFGAVIDKEVGLRAATEGSLSHKEDPRSAELDQVLRDHHSKLSTNISLLEERYTALPAPERFVNWNDLGRPIHQAVQPLEHPGGVLPRLLSQHTRLLADIQALIACAPDGQRGELILNGISRAHVEMAGVLSALMAHGGNHVAAAPAADGMAPETIRAQQRWDNEGGAVPPQPAPAGVPFPVSTL